MDYLPIFLDVRGQRVLVDGGDTAAARRIERALSAGALVTVCDPAPEDEVTRLLGEGVTHLARMPERADVQGCKVVYGASEDEARDQRLFDWARAEGVLVNVADVPDKCDFITPSIVDRAPIVVAISTSGSAPVIARTLRARIEAALPGGLGALAGFLDGFRERIFTAIPDDTARRHFWERLVDGPVSDLFLAGNPAAAEAQFDAELDASRTAPQGEVYLVGAGPGNPDLLTFGALRLMQRADVVLYDRLIGKDILSLVRRDAERIYVGKLPQDHTMPQEDISTLMVRLAREGKRVLRLKGGDPFIFGRGGEEIEVLAAGGVRFQVVPGITAAAGCSAYAGIPLTHRDHAQSCLFVTAHGRDGALELDWETMVRPAQTIAIYMGMANLGVLVDGFGRHGVSLETLVAIVENGTRPEQIVVTGKLSDIVQRAGDAGLKGPAVIIVGSVVALRERLQWAQIEGGDHELGLSARTSITL